MDSSNLPDTLPPLTPSFSDLEGQYNLPPNALNALMQVESGGNASAVGPPNPSGQRALGAFQFLPSTAAEQGLQDPFNKDQSAQAAARYLSKLKQKAGGSFEKALAYYSGHGGDVAKASDYISKVKNKMMPDTLPPLQEAQPNQEALPPLPTTLPPLPKESSIANIPSAIVDVTGKTMEDVQSQLEAARAHGESRGDVAADYFTGALTATVSGAIGFVPDAAREGIVYLAKKLSNGWQDLSPEDKAAVMKSPVSDWVNKTIEQYGQKAVTESPAYAAGKTAMGLPFGSGVTGGIREAGYPGLAAALDVAMGVSGVRSTIKGFKPKPETKPGVNPVEDMVRELNKQKPPEQLNLDLGDRQGQFNFNEPPIEGPPAGPPKDITFSRDRGIAERPAPVQGELNLEKPPEQGALDLVQQADALGRTEPSINKGTFGQSGAIDPNQIKDFWEWFKGSKGIDTEGKPKVFYQGTSKDKIFTEIKPNQRGAFFTDNPAHASQYAIENDSMDLKYDPITRKYENINTASRVIPTYLSYKNPYKLSTTEIEQYKYSTNYAKYQRDLANKIRTQGYDAIEYPDGSIAIFNSNQIKSALTNKSPNTGKFGQGGAIDSTMIGDLYNRLKDKFPFLAKIIPQYKTISDGQLGVWVDRLGKELESIPKDQQWSIEQGDKYRALLLLDAEQTRRSLGAAPEEPLKGPRLVVDNTKKPSPLGGPGKPQGGALNLFGKSAEEENKSTSKTAFWLGAIKSDTATFLSDLKDKFGEPSKTNPLAGGNETDIGHRVGMATGPYRATTPWTRAIDTPAEAAHAVGLHNDNAIRQAMALQHSIFYKELPTLTDYNKHYGIRSITGMSADNVKEFIKNTGIRLGFEKSQEGMQPGKWFPTTEEYIAKGMSPESAAIEHAADMTYDRIWNTEVEAARMVGKPIPDRIYAYRPHTWEGPYKATLDLVKPNGSLVPLKEFRYNTRAEAKAAMQELQKSIDASTDPQAANLKANWQEPEHRLNVGSMLEGITELRSTMEEGRGYEALLKSILDKSQQGMITNLMDRRNIPMSGFTLERTQNPIDSTFGLTKSQIRKSAESFQHDVAKASNYYSRVKYVNETLIPLERSGFLNPELFKNLTTAVGERRNAFLGIDQVLEAKINDKFSDMLVRAGHDPNGAEAVSNFIMSGTSKAYLFWSPRYWLANFFQFSNTAGYLQMVKAFGQATGEKVGSEIKAYLAAIPDLSDLKGPLRDGLNPRLDYALKNGHLEPTRINELDPHAKTDVIAMAEERRTRAIAFTTGYHYFKQILPEDQALRAAGSMADYVGVAYTPQYGRPIFYGQMQVGERMLSLFMTYNQHQLGMLNQQMALIGRSLKNGDLDTIGKIRGVASTLGSISAQALTQYALFGIGGVAFVNNYEDIVWALNKALDVAIPTSREFSRWLDKQMAESKGILKDFAGMNTFGLTGTASGYDVSSSGSGPGFVVPSAAPHLLEVALLSAILGLRAGANKVGLSDREITSQDIWGVAREAPSRVAAPIEFVLKPWATTYEALSGINPDYWPTKNIATEHGEERTKVQSWMRFWNGMYSLDEASFHQTQNIDSMHEAAIKDKAANLVQVMKEKGDISEKDLERMVDYFQEYGINPGESISAMINTQIWKDLSPDERKFFEGSSSLAGLEKYNRWLNERQNEYSRITK